MSAKLGTLGWRTCVDVLYQLWGVDDCVTTFTFLYRGVEVLKCQDLARMSEYSAVRGGKLKLKGGLVSGQKKKKRKREQSKHDEDGEYKHGREW